MFIIVGDGPLKKQLQDRAAELGIKNKVIFTGYRSDIPENSTYNGCICTIIMD